MNFTFVLEPSPLDERDDPTGLLADALVRRGHEVRIVAEERPPGFRGGRRAEWIESFDGRGQVVPRDLLIVADDVYRDKPRHEREPLRVLLAGAIESEARRIDDGYGAVAHARWFHQSLDLIRASPWAPSRGEPLDAVQEFHVGLNEEETTRLLHSCDVVLVPAGMSLLAAEAMAACVAVVMGPARDAVELGDRLIEVLSDEEIRSELRRTGRERAESFVGELVAAAYEKRFTTEDAESTDR